MIPVKPAPEPPDFDRTVRQPGLRAIAELVGKAPQRRAGKPFDQVADSRDMIPAWSFPPYWREALDGLQAAYNRVCAYLCVRISTDPSVDHYVAKSPELGSGLRVEQLSVGVRGDEQLQE